MVMLGGMAGMNALRERGRRYVAELKQYDARHPDHGPDANGRPYDPWGDVIVSPRPQDDTGERGVDPVRSDAIERRAWEGFAWADHRFVLSDDHGRHVIVGFNVDAQRWFVDDITPVKLPEPWVEAFMARTFAGRTLRSVDDPKVLHDEIVARVGGEVTVPALEEVKALVARLGAA